MLFIIYSISIICSTINTIIYKYLSFFCAFILPDSQHELTLSAPSSSGLYRGIPRGCGAQQEILLPQRINPEENNASVGRTHSNTRPHPLDHIYWPNEMMYQCVDRTLRARASSAFWRRKEMTHNTHNQCVWHRRIYEGYHSGDSSRIRWLALDDGFNLCATDAMSTRVMHVLLMVK